MLDLLKYLSKGEIDISSLYFMNPVLLVGILSAYKQGKIIINGVDENSLKGYIKHSGFLSYFPNVKSKNNKKVGYENLIPISHIHKDINPSITDELAEKITDDREVLFSFSFILRELLDNTIRHSKADFDKLSCYYMLQKYPANNTVHICIADNGIGIRKSLENKFDLETDLDYILKAFEKGVTSRGKAGGNGLFFTKEIVKKSGSKLYYWSGDFICIIDSGEEKSINTKKEYGLSWKGILLDIELNLNNINSELMQKIGINVKEELDNMEDDIFM